MNEHYTPLGKFPGKKLVGAERYKKLYHYTSFDTFVKIWLNKNLRFAKVMDVNDIEEAAVSISTSDLEQVSLMEDLLKLRISYKQISFTMDYDTFLKGCLSPMMWGYYADRRKGVCIELEFDKLAFSEDIIKGPVIYKKKLKRSHEISKRIKTQKGLAYYVKRNKKRLFFTKRMCWSGENEYRILSNKQDYLNIDGAITAVYLTSCHSQECLLVEKLVNGQVPIKVIKYQKALFNDSLPYIQDLQVAREIYEKRHEITASINRLIEDLKIN